MPTLRKWLISLVAAVVLAALALTAPRWLPPLLAFTGARSDQISGLADLAQIFIWIGAALAALFAWLRRPRRAVSVPPVAAGPSTASRAAVKSGGAVAQNESAAADREGIALQDSSVGGDLLGAGARKVTVEQVRFFTRIYLGAPGEAAVDAAGFGEALESYLKWFRESYGRLNLRGIERRERQVLTLSLDDVYVSLAASLAPARRGAGGRHGKVEAERGEEPRVVDMAELLAASPRLAILGGPGSGKTTYLQLVGSALAAALQRDDPAPAARLGIEPPLPLPVFVALSEFNRYRRQHAGSAEPRHGTLTAFITHQLLRHEAPPSLPDDFFARLLRERRSVLLLLDGLDEVADERERELVRRAVEELAGSQQVERILVTSRSRAYRGGAVLPEDFRLAEVQPMTPEQVDALAERWCRAVYSETEATAETVRLRAAIAGLEASRQARGEPRLIDTPLLTTIVAIVAYNQRRLPEERAELYEKCVDVLLSESHKPATEALFELEDWGGSLPEKRALLAALAFDMMNAGEEAGRSVSEEQLRIWLEPRLASRRGPDRARAELATFVQAMRERGSLLDERGGDYRFLHLTFQEFLCAFHLAESLREPGKIADFLVAGGRVGQAWWRETVLLVAGYLGTKSQEAALDLLRRLAAAGGPDELPLAAVELAGTALLELESQDPATRSVVVPRLVALLGDPHLEAPAPLRAAAGRALGRLGDPRSGIGLGGDGVPQIDWLAVAAGPCTMGSRKGETPWDDETPRFTCSLVREPFRIAGFPVTVGQYAAFVVDDGYARRELWTSAGWTWRQREKVDGPESYGEPFEIRNHPRVGVSWYEAMAFCRWLSLRPGREVVLPTEAQWERAARHTDGRVHPWEGSFEPGRCNSSEAGIGATSAVGVFPAGAAVCGALDMVGNAWEWSRTRWLGNYDDYENRVGDPLADAEEDSRVVLRGGSFSNVRVYVRCAFRYWFAPWFRHRYVGFRVVSPGL